MLNIVMNNKLNLPADLKKYFIFYKCKFKQFIV